MEKVSYLEQLKEQHKTFCAQRDHTQNNLQQLVGAIYACELMITKLESEMGVDKDVKTDESEAEQAAEG
jgi:uncharacterized protein YaaN involved in tellurite resistance